jgi:hypothetical protein
MQIREALGRVIDEADPAGLATKAERDKQARSSGNHASSDRLNAQALAPVRAVHRRRLCLHSHGASGKAVLGGGLPTASAFQKRYRDD